MGYEVRNHKLHHLHHKHRHSSNARNNPAPPLAIPYLPAPPLLPSPSSNYDANYNYNYSLAPYPNNMSIQTIDHQEQLNKALADVRRHGRNERIGEIGAAAAGAFAMYELHEAKVDPMHARRHKMEAQLAGAVALGSAGYALHEHKEKKKSEHLVEVLNGTGRQKDSAHHKKISIRKGESKSKWLK